MTNLTTTGHGTDTHDKHSTLDMETEYVVSFLWHASNFVFLWKWCFGNCLDTQQNTATRSASEEFWSRETGEVSTGDANSPLLGPTLMCARTPHWVDLRNGFSSSSHVVQSSCFYGIGVLETVWTHNRTLTPDQRLEYSGP